MVGGNACLLLGRACQGQAAGLPGLGIEGLHRVAHRVNIRIRGLHPLVDLDAAGLADLQPRILGKARLRCYADGHDHCVGRQSELLAVLDGGDVSVLNGRQGAVHAQADAMVIQLLLQGLHHVVVKGCQDLAHALHHGHVLVGQTQVLRRFDADEPAAYDHHVLHIFPIQARLDPHHVADIPHGEHVVPLDAPDAPGHNGGRAGGQHQLVIALRKGFPGLCIPHRHAFGHPVNGSDLAVDGYVNIVFPLEALGGHHDQILSGFHHAA